MNGPTNPPPSSSGSDALKLLELLSDKGRAAEVIAAHDKAKAEADAALVKLAEERAKLTKDSEELLVRMNEVASREKAVEGCEVEAARKRDGDLRDLESQRGVVTMMSKEMADRKVKFEQDWAGADAAQRSRTAALDERERLLVQREETVRAKEVQTAADREAYERDRAMLDSKQTNLRKLLEHG